ncbi:MAG: hypothetical protein EBS32_08735 [Actinobacteria bacterium]|nr:hypothetical protein [Actinomycetota bacterium]
MQITEADRLDMLAELRRCHGERIGDIIVEHLPPAGWGDLARQVDISRLEQRIDASDLARAQDIARLERRIEASDLAHQADIARLEREIARLDGRINNLAGAMWAMGGIMTAGFMGLFTLIATKL